MAFERVLKAVKKIKGASINFVRNNWGLPFVVISFFLMIAAALALLSGFYSLAVDTCIYFFYTFAIAVLLEFIHLLKARSKFQ